MRAAKTPRAEPRQAAAHDRQPSAWRNRRFVIFAAGNLANNIGDAIYAIAMPLLVYNLTRSLAAMSVLAVLAPATLLIGPAFGVVADRRGSRVLVLGGLAVQLAAALALNLVIAAGYPSLALIIPLSALVQVGGAAYRQGWMAGVPAMFPDAPVRARGTLSSLYVSSTIVGPMLVGATVGWLGYLGLLWVNMATFCAPIAVWMMRVHPPKPSARAADEGAGDAARAARTGLWRDIAEGWDIIRRSPEVLRFIAAVLPMEVVASAGMITLAIYYLRDHWHLAAGGVGIVFTVVSVCSLAGSLAVSERSRFRPRQIIAVGTIGMTACLLAMALPVLGAFVAALAVFFGLNSGMAVASDMLLVKHLPPSAIGRTVGITRLIYGIPLVVGPLVIPLIVDLVGVRLALVTLACFALCSIVLMLRHWASWDATQPTPEAPPSGVSLPGLSLDKESSCVS